MPKPSAGILLFRKSGGEVEFFLVHPGGPFFAKKQHGWWTIPKGELMPDEDPLDAAQREFTEETGFTIEGTFIPLSSIQQKGGKTVLCWAVEGDLDATKVVSNTFEMQWPPKSGRMQIFPEIDQAGWLGCEEAKLLINERQAAFLDEVIKIMGYQAGNML